MLPVARIGYSGPGGCAAGGWPFVPPPARCAESPEITAFPSAPVPDLRLPAKHPNDERGREGERAEGQMGERG